MIYGNYAGPSLRRPIVVRGFFVATIVKPSGNHAEPDVRPALTLFPMSESLKNLRTPIVNGRISEYFNRLFTNPIDLRDINLHPFPHLKTLGIGNACFGKVDYNAPHEAPALRQKCGLMLGEIMLSRCYGLPKDIIRKMETVCRIFVPGICILVPHGSTSISMANSRTFYISSPLVGFGSNLTRWGFLEISC